MIVFNTTYLVSPSVHDAWLQWITSFYIPDMLSTGCFSSPKLYKVLIDEKDGLNYSLQFSAPTVAKVKEWQDKYRDRQQTQLRETFGESVLFFSTYLKEVF